MKKLGILIILAISLVFTVSCVSKEVPVTETYYETEYRTETYTTTEFVATGVKAQSINLTPIVKWSEGLESRSSISQSQTSYYGYNIDTTKYPQCNIQIFFSYTGLEPNQSRIIEALKIYNLTGVGQITLPTNFTFGEKGEWELVELKNLMSFYQYTPTLQEQQWLKEFKSRIGVPLPEQSTFKFDATGIKEFAIITQTMKSITPSPFSTSIEIQSVKLTQPATVEKTVTRERGVPYEVEKQRTTMQTKKVPFWEAIFSK